MLDSVILFCILSIIKICVVAVVQKSGRFVKTCWPEFGGYADAAAVVVLGALN